MAKVYYTVDLQNGYSQSCVIEFKEHVPDEDYKTLIHVFNPIAKITYNELLLKLLYFEFHTGVGQDKLIKGSSVISVYNIHLGE